MAEKIHLPKPSRSWRLGVVRLVVFPFPVWEKRGDDSTLQLKWSEIITAVDVKTFFSPPLT